MSNTKVKIHYDPQTGLVKGNYPNREKFNYPIPEPYFEIEEALQDKTGKQMIYLNGIYQEYVEPLSVQLEQAKNSKIRRLKDLRESRLRLPTPQAIVYQGNLSNRTFDISVREHLPIFNGITSTLGRKIAAGQVSPTREWTDASGERLDLTIADYESLVDHLDLRDEQEHSQYNSKKKAIEDFSLENEYFDENDNPINALEALNNYDINQIV